MQKNRRLLCVAVVLFRSLSFSLFFLSDFRLIGVVEEKTSHHHLVCPLPLRKSKFKIIQKGEGERILDTKLDFRGADGQTIIGRSFLTSFLPHFLQDCINKMTMAVGRKKERNKPSSVPLSGNLEKKRIPLFIIHQNKE